jgi:hypothetical protein
VGVGGIDRLSLARISHHGPLAVVGASAEFGILGGTGDFRKARGEGTLVVTAAGVVDTTLTLK